MSDKPFTREDLAQADVQLLRDGRAANAVVTCVTWKGRRWTVKDFSSRSWWVRRLLAPFLLGRELKILRRSPASTAWPRTPSGSTPTPSR